MTNIEKQMEEMGYYFTKYNDRYTLSTLKDGSVLFDFFCDSEEELKEGLIKGIKIHLQRIEDEDENYFDGCDVEYLKTKWKNELENILLHIESKSQQNMQ